jgi:hypothetical protein
MPKRNASLFILVVLVVVTICAVSYWYINKRKVSKLTPSIARIQKTQSGNCSWAIVGSDNVELLVTDPSGRQEGFLQLSSNYVYDIPDASYGFQQGLKDDTGKNPPLPSSIYFGQNNAEDGIYTLQIISTQPGKYHTDIGIGCSSTNSKAVPIDGELTKNQSDNYTITFPSGSVKKIK